MDRLTNPYNSWMGSKIPPAKVQGIESYVVDSIPIRSKQSLTISELREGSPKVNKRHEIMEFGNSRSAKAWGSRRIHSTIYDGKGSSFISSEELKLSGFKENEQLQKLKNAIKEGTKITNLCLLMSDPEVLIACWSKIKSKEGGLTTAFEEKKPSNGLSEEWFKRTANSFINGSFDFKPARRVQIPNPNGKLNSITIPSLKDKIVMEAMRNFLEIIFEKEVSDKSNGWRPSRGRFSTLQQIKRTFGAARWFIEGDIGQQFPTLGHQILIGLLREKIDDQPFIDLIYKYLKVGYGVEHKDIKPIKVEVIQGGNLSPTLANIYMTSFDNWMEEKVIPTFEKGPCRRAHADGNDPSYKRINYVRYADEFLVGVIGSRKDCEEIRENMKNFLEKRLKFVMNIEKIKITHSTKGSVKFLEHRFHMTEINKIPINYNSRGVLTPRTPRLIMDAPIKEVVNKLVQGGFARGEGKPTRNGKFIHLPLPKLIQHYCSIERRIRQFYGKANNYDRLVARVHYVLKYSCALTIASKMRLRTMNRVFSKYGKNLSVRNEKGEIITSYLAFRGTRPDPTGYTPYNLSEKRKKGCARPLPTML